LHGNRRKKRAGQSGHPAHTREHLETASGEGVEIRAGIFLAGSCRRGCGCVSLFSRLRCLRLALTILGRLDLLKLFLRLELLGECGGGGMEFSATITWSADVLFVDPATSGSLAELSAIPVTQQPLVVVVSAKREHLAPAFEMGAIDFLVKPLATERFSAALLRIRIRHAERMNSEASSLNRRSELKRLTVRRQDRLIVVPVPEIDWIESANNYMVLHVGDVSHIVRETMSRLEQRLPSGFLRVSRSAIVNITRIREITVDDAGDHRLLLAGGALVPITRRIRELQHRLECD
jgi:two-component system LytT family response regulator